MYPKAPIRGPVSCIGQRRASASGALPGFLKLRFSGSGSAGYESLSKDKPKLCKHAALKKFTKVRKKVKASKPMHETGMENPSKATITIIVGVVCAWSLVLPFDYCFGLPTEGLRKLLAGNRSLTSPIQCSETWPWRSTEASGTAARSGWQLRNSLVT